MDHVPVCGGWSTNHIPACAGGKADKQSGQTKRANIAGAGASRGAGPHFAHSVTILLSGIDRFVGPESVQSGRVMFM